MRCPKNHNCHSCLRSGSQCIVRLMSFRGHVSPSRVEVMNRAGSGAAEVGYKVRSQKRRSQQGNYTVGLFNRTAATFNCEYIHGPISDFRCHARARPLKRTKSTTPRVIDVRIAPDSTSKQNACVDCLIRQLVNVSRGSLKRGLGARVIGLTEAWCGPTSWDGARYGLSA
jgi:hypothetical protein